MPHYNANPRSPPAAFRLATDCAFFFSRASLLRSIASMVSSSSSMLSAPVPGLEGLVTTLAAGRPPARGWVPIPVCFWPAAQAPGCTFAAAPPRLVCGFWGPDNDARCSGWRSELVGGGRAGSATQGPAVGVTVAASAFCSFRAGDPRAFVW